MFKNYLNGIDGIATYPVLLLVIFFLFFVAMSVWLIRADKNQLQILARLPLQDSNEDTQINE